MIKVSQIKVTIGHDPEMLRQAILKKLHLRPEELIAYKILRQSLDARQTRRGSREGGIYYQYTVAVALKNERAYLKKHHHPDITAYEPSAYVLPAAADRKPAHPPVIIGSGPAGLFCGLVLARQGYAPILLERGCDVNTRMEKVRRFWEQGVLDPDCNVQFGEGGAGTFSDGKLNTLVKDPSGRHQKVLELFVEAGAPEEILYVQKPHIGTDRLVEIVAHIRGEIIRLGGQVRFEAKVTDFLMDETGRLTGLEINGSERMAASHVVLAIGHSARDTFEKLHERQIVMEQKPFAIGVRVEHPQAMIDAAQYGDAADQLPPASYKLTYRTKAGRSVYTFCMCPGGYVVNASSEAGMTAVNGMSNQQREGHNANSAVIVNVSPQDFGSTHPLAGMAFQRHWEHLAWEEGRGRVPVQLLEDFRSRRSSEAFGEIQPAHKGGWAFGNLWHCLPDYVCESLLEGMDAFGRKIQGYNRGDTILSGVETRTSSPVKIPRNETFQCSVSGLYPCGEGAGYAGGITSAAMDGLRVAEAVAQALRGEA